MTYSVIYIKYLININGLARDVFKRGNVVSYIKASVLFFFSYYWIEMYVHTSEWCVLKHKLSRSDGKVYCFKNTDEIIHMEEKIKVNHNMGLDFCYTEHFFVYVYFTAYGF